MLEKMSESAPSSKPDWLVYPGENEGHPLIVLLDREPGNREPFFHDKRRPWAILVELPLPRVDSNALPVPEDWPTLEAIEAALVRDLATDEDDWTYVVRTYGEGVCRFGFYARRSSAAEARIKRTLAEFDPEWHTPSVKIFSDPKWAAYHSFFPEDQQPGPTPPQTPTQTPTHHRQPNDLGGVAPSFRDDPDTGPSPSFRARSQFRPREDQPWRGDTPQVHPED